MSNRNIYIDYLKIICAFLVVYIHAGINSDIISSVSTVAVPVFFTISGFLYQAVTVRKEKQITQILKISKLFLVSFVFYVMWSGLAMPLIKGDAMAIGKQLSVAGAVKLLLMNAPTYGYHLWYLVSLVYVLVIETMVDKARSEKLERFATVCSVVLLVIGISIPIVCEAFNLPYRIEIVRNFLFEGYPMFHGGRVIAEKCSNDKKHKNDGAEVEKHGIIAIYTTITICLVVGLLLERNIYNSFGIQASLTIFNVALAVVLVLLMIYLNDSYSAEHNQQYSNENRNIEGSKTQVVRAFKPLGGSGLSTGIYIIHVFVLSIINYLEIFDDGLLKTILCFCISALLVIIWERMRNTINGHVPYNRGI